MGVSAKPLGAKELQEFESKFADLPHRLPEKKLLTEFEYPVVEKRMALIDGNEEQIRGSSKKPAPSAERLTVDHPQLRKWFEAYRGWVFETR